MLKNFTLLTGALAALALSFISTSALAQSGISLYHLGNSTIQVNQFNPAQQAKGTFNLALPLLSKQSIGFTNAFSVNDIFEKQANGNYRLMNEKLYRRVDNNGNLNLDLDKITLFQAGFTLPSKGLGFTLFSNLTSSHQLYYSKGLFQLLLGGTAQSIDKQLLIEDAQLSSMTYADFGLGVQKTLLDNKLKVGANVKYLMGIAYLQSHEDLKISLNTDPDTYAMTFNLQNVSYLHALPLDLKGKSLTDEESDPEFDFDRSRHKGFAVDLGATYTLIDKLDLSLAVTDLGAITWKKVTKEEVEDKTFTFEGANLDPEGGEFNFADSLEVYFKAKSSDAGSIKTSLPTRTMFSASYRLTERDIFSSTYMATFREKETRHLYGFGYTRKVGSVLALSVNAVKQPQQQLGLGVGTSLQLGPVQLYVASDNVLSSIKVADARGADFKFGFNFLFGRKTASKAQTPQLPLPAASVE